MNLAEFRSKYPQYENTPDETLVPALHKKYYADKISLEEFSKKVGYAPKVEEVTQEEPGTLSKLGQFGKRAAIAPIAGVGDVVRGVGASIAQQNPEDYELSPSDIMLINKRYEDAAKAKGLGRNEFDPELRRQIKDEVATEAQAANKVTETSGLAPEQVRAGRQESNRIIGGGLLKVAEKIPEVPREPGFKGGIMGEIVEPGVVGGLQSIPAMALSAVPIAGQLAIYEQIKGAKYKELIESGKSPDVAENAASLSAVLQTPFESLGNILQMGIITKYFKSAAKTLPKKLANFGITLSETAITEGIENVPQDAMDVASDIYAENPNASIKEIVDKTISIWKKPEFQAQMGKSFAQGAVGGLALGGLAGAGRVPFDVADLVRKPPQARQAPAPETPHPLIQKIQSDLASGALTPDQAKALRDSPEIANLNLTEDIGNIIGQYETVQAKAKIAEAVSQSVAAQPGEERATVIAEQLIPEVTAMSQLREQLAGKKGRWVDERGGLIEETPPTREMPQVQPPVEVSPTETPQMGIEPREAAGEIATPAPVATPEVEETKEVERPQPQREIEAISQADLSSRLPEGKKLKDFNVQIQAIRESTGERVTIEENAQIALNEADGKITTYRKLVECLNA